MIFNQKKYNYKQTRINQMAIVFTLEELRYSLCHSSWLFVEKLAAEIQLGYGE